MSMDISEIEEMLEFSLNHKDPNAAQLVIRYAIAEKLPLHSLDSVLHYRIMLLLAIKPKKETRGRKKTDAKEVLYLESLACTIRAALDGATYSTTWFSYAESKSRPKQGYKEAKRCAEIIQICLSDDGQRAKRANRAMSKFGLNESDLKRSCE